MKSASLNIYTGPMPPSRAFLFRGEAVFSLKLSRKFFAYALEMKQPDAPDPDNGTEFCRIEIGQECIWQGSMADAYRAVHPHYVALCKARSALIEQRRVRNPYTKEILEAFGLVHRIQERIPQWRERERAQQKLWDGLIKSAVRKAPA